jgi:predicted DCC family thiol-disulfide oxidoreductase YuxK
MDEGAQHDAGKTKVYYNSACPVCKAGIEYQQRKLGAAAGDVEWIDVHMRNEAACDVNPDLEFVRERLHVVDEAGGLHVGAEAFAELWRKTPGQNAWARIVRTPVIRPLSRWLYNGFAALLYRWNRINRRW